MLFSISARQENKSVPFSAFSEVAQLEKEALTPTDRMLIRFYRQLDEGGQTFVRRAIEAIATHRVRP